MSKKLSICIPVYNGGSRLPSTLDALAEFNADFCDINILYNHSEDDTFKYAKKRARSASKIFVYSFSKNTGQPGNFNRCPRYAKNSFFAWLGAGDQTLPGYYERTIAYLEKHPASALCYTADLVGKNLSGYAADTWQEMVLDYFCNLGLANINFGVMRARMAKKLFP